LDPGLVETYDQEFFIRDVYVFEKWGLLFNEGRGRKHRL
jgi:hypothetical protein